MKLDLYEYFPITDYSNQIYYPTKTERDKAFEKIEHLTFEKLSHCNMSKGQIRLQMEYYQGNKYNYGIITDSDKKYFIFINSCTWNDNQQIVTLNFTIDVWQTYCYRVKFQQCLIEREHVTNDSKFKYLVDEGMPISTYKRLTSKEYKINDFLVVLSLGDSSLVKIDAGAGLNNIDCITKVNDKEYTNTLITGTLKQITSAINWYVDDGKIDSIVGVYLIPNVGVTTKDCVLVTQDEKKHDGNGQLIGFNYISAIASNVGSLNIAMPSSIDGYVPKNNKCFNSPYVICQLTNLNGNTVQIPLELSNGYVDIQMYFPVTQGSVPVAYPRYFNGLEKNLEYAVSGLPTVQVPWNSDTFASYIAQNQNSITNNYKELERNREYSHLTNGINTATSFINSTATGNALGMTSTLINGVTNAMNTELNYSNSKNRMDASLKDTQSKGDLVHGTFNGTAPYLVGEYGFKLSILGVNAQNIEMIDNYFTMYGYKVNDIKIPNLNSRSNWNFIKTAGCNITASIPVEAINTIKSMFDSGTTLWHDVNTMYDYSKTNSIN